MNDTMTTKTKVCRTCFALITDSNFVSLSDPAHLMDFTLIKEVVEDFINKLNLDAVIEPLMCNSCWSTLREAYVFKAMCLKNESYLLAYIKKCDRTIESAELLKVAEEVCKESTDNELDTAEDCLDQEYIDSKVNIKLEVSELEVGEVKSPVDRESNSFTGFMSSEIQHAQQQKASFEVQKNHGNLKKIVGNGFTNLCCPHCGKTFKSKPNYEVHLKSHSDLTPFTCEVCGKSYSKKGQLNLHLRKHSGLTRHTCEICGKTYGEKGHLNVHLRKHKEGRPFLCEICGKSYTTSQQLKVHLLTHTDKELRMCEICKKRFSHTTDFNKHKQTHRTDKPYRCEICGKSFSQASYLNTHRRIHQTDKRTYKCEYCSKSYRHHTNLAAHRRTHKGLSYECEICYKSFGYECLLRRHLLMHSTERPHKCAICGKGFNRPIVLKQHMQVHSGEKAYVCEWCGKRFSQNSSRKRHLKECACAKSGNDKDLEGDETVREEKT